jgi:autonomous glycyl radical cofactor GrcA
VVVVTRETANEILKIYQKYPALEGQFLFELVRLAWSVCEELRNLANNPASNSNWYDDSEKIKKLGLMGKGGYAETIKKQEVEEKKRMREEEELTAAKEVRVLVCRRNSLSRKKMRFLLKRLSPRRRRQKITESCFRIRINLIF